MNWQKYTINEWLAQFGLWCNNSMMKGGNLPDGLHINQIYWLMQQSEPTPSRERVICQISDSEALAVNALLCEAKELLPKQIELVVLCKVQGQSLRDVADKYKVSHSQVKQWVNGGLFYLAGLKRLAINL